jgi:hypothetical protein
MNNKINIYVRLLKVLYKNIYNIAGDRGYGVLRRKMMKEIRT